MPITTGWAETVWNDKFALHLFTQHTKSAKTSDLLIFYQSPSPLNQLIYRKYNMSKPLFILIVCIYGIMDKIQFIIVTQSTCCFSRMTLKVQTPWVQQSMTLKHNSGKSLTLNVFLFPLRNHSKVKG